ncbi:MAG: hypothetical protein KGN32_04205 [Burkholderiales bacterium]|nr:hypothetical protein [Burkholderiales bacterium]
MQLDAGQAAATLCPEADVFHAENKVESSKVSVAIEPTAQADGVNLRISSSATIDEPVVTVYLRAGCTQKTTRRFVLLADYPSETVAPVATAPNTAIVTPESTPVKIAEAKADMAVTAPSTAPTAPERPRKTATTPPAKRSPAKATVTAAAPASGEKAAVASRPAASSPARAGTAPSTKTGDGTRSRLKLDPLENLAERIKTLEATTPTVPLEEMVRDSQRIQQLQTDVKALLEQAAKNEASLLAMRQRLEKAESEQVSMGLVWALGALVLLCIGAIVILWNRKSELSAWQQSVQDATPSAPLHSVASQPEPVKSEPVPVRAATSNTFTLKKEIAPPHMDVDVNLMDMDSDFSKLIAPAVPHPATVIAPIYPSRSTESRLPHLDYYSEGIADVLQQAEFFEKLGKLDQAIDVLEQRIRLGKQDAPLLYMDLLRIAHAHDLKTDFRQFRDEFEQSFNVNVPEFVLFRDTGRSLESYLSLTQHICQNWPTPAALEMIETCVVRDPWEKNAEPFDIGAFSELILLHGLLTRILKAAGTNGAEEAANAGHVDIPT